MAGIRLGQTRFCGERSTPTRLASTQAKCHRGPLFVVIRLHDDTHQEHSPQNDAHRRQTGDLQTVLELLGRGAKVGVKAKNNLGATPLHLAAKLGATRIARELLAVGARPDAKDQARTRSFGIPTPGC